MPGASYPVTYSIQRPERYNRWMVGFRFIVGLPLALLLSTFYHISRAGLSIGGGLSGLVLLLAVFAWFTILFTGRFPVSMRNTALFLFRWIQNITAYLYLLADPYPPFSDGPYPLRIDVTPAERYNRWTVGFRLILVIPHIILLFFLGIAWFIVTVIAWFAIVFTGQYPASIYEFSVGVARWGARVAAYIYLFVDEYPPFSLSEEAGATGFQPEPA